LLQLNGTHGRPIGDDNELHDQQELLQQSFVAVASHIATSLLGAGFCMHDFLQTGPDRSLQKDFGAFTPDSLAQAM